MASITQLTTALETVLRRGLSAINPNAPYIELYLTTSPEAGSVRICLIAAAVTSIGVAANLSQITGVDITDVLRGLRIRIYESEEDFRHIDPAVTVAANRQFGTSASKLIQAAGQYGYDSVRIEADGISIELTRTQPQEVNEAIEMLRRRLNRLEDTLSQLPEPAPFVENVRVIDEHRAGIEAEIAMLRVEMDELKRKAARRPRKRS